MTELFDGYEFALCLTHDVDRPYKTFQAPYYAVKESDPSHLRSLLTDERPYWQFDEVMALEEEFGVRSSFYFLNEKRLFRDKGPRDWVNPESWKLFTGRYRVDDDEIADVIRRLDRGGWEIGLHGSYESYDDRERLRREKAVLERVLGDDVIGGRQHYLRLDRPTTWKHQRAIGLRYDATLGSNDGYGFDGRYDVIRPFDDAFVAFPLTVMERPHVESADTIDEAWRECRRLLVEADENDAIMTVLWHPLYFNDDEFPGYTDIYERMIETAAEMGAWIGACGECYDHLEATRPVR